MTFQVWAESCRLWSTMALGSALVVVGSSAGETIVVVVITVVVGVGAAVVDVLAIWVVVAVEGGVDVVVSRSAVVLDSGVDDWVVTGVASDGGGRAASSPASGVGEASSAALLAAPGSSRPQAVRRIASASHIATNQGLNTDSSSVPRTAAFEPMQEKLVQEAR